MITPNNPTSTSGSADPPAIREICAQVFISYSHNDREWLEKLETMLTPLQRQGTLEIWTDIRIQPGQVRKKEIQKALTKAKVAVLLVSSDFLASRFIHEDELLPLLEASRKEGLIILWVPVRPCLYEETAISEYQAAYDPETPLSTLSRSQQEVALKKIVQTIKIARLTNTSQNPPTRSTNPSSTKRAPQAASSRSPELIPPPPTHKGKDLLIVFVLGILGGTGVYHVGKGWLEKTFSSVNTGRLTHDSAQEPSQYEFRSSLKDGGQGPLMVFIRNGHFLMGSPVTEPRRNRNERQHDVRMTLFALSKYEITFEEYDHFAEATQRDKPPDGGWGRGRRPVFNVSWYDAVAYTEWLSQQTGKSYRLPTEAEWEYACRAGTTTAYYFGTTITNDLANFTGWGTVSNNLASSTGWGTVEVGEYPANAWGLHDMHGNVWEWTCSEYKENYDGAEKRCNNDPNSSTLRVVRGGSWLNTPDSVRGAVRYGEDPHGSRWNLYIGFRVAME